jgi:hypothetical protein
VAVVALGLVVAFGEHIMSSHIVAAIQAVLTAGLAVLGALLVRQRDWVHRRRGQVAELRSALHWFDRWFDKRTDDYKQNCSEVTQDFASRNMLSSSIYPGNQARLFTEFARDAEERWQSEVQDRRDTLLAATGRVALTDLDTRLGGDYSASAGRTFRAIQDKYREMAERLQTQGTASGPHDMRAIFADVIASKNLSILTSGWPETPSLDGGDWE